MDSVTAGDDQSEHDHHLQGDVTSTREVNGRNYRTADTNRWFSWELKVSPGEPQEMAVEFGGGGGNGGRRAPVDNVNILVDWSPLTSLRLNGGPRLEYYPLKPELIAGKTNITVRFEAVSGSRISGVHRVEIARPPAPTIASMSKASSPRTNYQYIVNVVNDLREPASSGDRLKRHFDWWPAKGTNQWVQYDFAKPARVSMTEVYWFDDTGIGECRMPKSWQAFYRENGEWKPVQHPSGYGCEPDHYNRTTFDAVTTDGLRLDVELPERFSSGILQWRVE